MINGENRTRHRTERALLGVVDDSNLVYSETRFDEECVGACSDTRVSHRVEWIYALNLASGRAVELARDTLALRTGFIRPYVYRESPGDSLIRIDPFTLEQTTLARPFGSFPGPRAQAYLASGGKFLMVHDCAGAVCLSTVYDAVSREWIHAVPLSSSSLYLDPDSLVLYGLNDAQAPMDSTRIPVYAYTLADGAEGLNHGLQLSGKYLFTFRLYGGSGVLLYRDSTALRMFPDVRDQRFRNRLESLAALPGTSEPVVNPESGAYFQTEGGRLLAGNLFTGMSKPLFELSLSDPKPAGD